MDDSEYEETSGASGPVVAATYHVLRCLQFDSYESMRRLIEGLGLSSPLLGAIWDVRIVILDVQDSCLKSCVEVLLWDHNNGHIYNNFNNFIYKTICMTSRIESQSITET
jgi:hypothetical protein